ncbi:MAG: hypothetical protein L3J07_04680 [Candidatus Magasanikbacteria bacterium]|nr:hypothetical protein [Candidatus Magasanikbacteria bacterium]
MKDTLSSLIKIAKQKMKHSSDSIHDLEHVKNVVNHVKTFSNDLHLNSKQKNALVLAAWWHDVSRTVPNKTSFIWMPFLDDIISALMLWFFTLKYKLFGELAGTSIKLILCKSLGTGAFFTKILFKKKNRFLVDLLKDADTLDVLGIERMKKTLDLVEESKIYYFGYKTATWWFISKNKLKMKTKVAQKYLEKLIKQFIAWVSSKEVKDFFEKTFGLKWADKMLSNINRILDTLILTGLKTT